MLGCNRGVDDTGGLRSVRSLWTAARATLRRSSCAACSGRTEIVGQHEELRLNLIGERVGGGSFQLVAVDLRGDKSETTPPGTYGWEHHARDVMAVADTLGFERFAAIGRSMGGAVAIKVAELDRARFGRRHARRRRWPCRSCVGEPITAMGDVRPTAPVGNASVPQPLPITFAAVGSPEMGVGDVEDMRRIGRELLFG
jgi:pimeloyl-ACP methyl ester carboxylesterase